MSPPAKRLRTGQDALGADARNLATRLREVSGVRHEIPAVKVVTLAFAVDELHRMLDDLAAYLDTHPCGGAA